jgi:serine/threonine protein kinase
LVSHLYALTQRPPLTSTGQLGKGAFATVYRIATKMEGKLLAAKELEKRRFIKNGQLDKKIDNEMRIMQSLRHPNIVEFVEHHDQGDYLYIIMEYVPHGDLQAHLHQEGPLSEIAARAMSQQILSALGYLHHSRITHRDIKPDNILIAEQNPLRVKLSDFGLSKVVKHDDTFLKTFCGTLLYCAPEVFPDYGTTKGTKRRRGAKHYHSYSSSVDIWSFGGVLWYALCKEPPFKGIADATGEAMYNNIIATPLDPRPLQRAGVSETCINLLTRMLLVDPALRPTARECLQHPWLIEGATLPADHDLQSIVEEDESQETEQKLSQLSIGIEQEEEDEISGSDEEVDVLSDKELVGFVDANRQTKRIRADPLHPQNNTRDIGAFSANASFQSDYGVDEGESFVFKANQDQARLFGEIGQSALQSSGILESHIREAVLEENSQNSSHYGSENLPMYSHTAERAEREIPFSAPPPYLENPFSSPSLFGAESMVRDLNMISDQGATMSTDGRHSPNGPTTPRTPEVAQHSSLELSSKFPSLVSEATPKARPSGVSRQISLPLTASYYYDPLDPSTHNLEYASRVSGIDFVKAHKQTTAATSGYEETAEASEPTNSNSSMEAPSEEGAEPSASAAVPSLPAELDIRPPPRRLGKLVSTKDSFVAGLTINLDRNRTSWGRKKDNTLIYENMQDTRIPKTAFVLFWYSSAGESNETVQQMSQEGKDWTSLPDLHSCIWPHATHGITVNGTRVMQRDSKGRALYGHLHTGDIVQVGDLKFRCEFYLGSGKEAREEGNSFTVLVGAQVRARVG